MLSPVLSWLGPTAAAGHMAPEEVRAAVAAVPAGAADLSENDMAGDDLSGLDLSAVSQHLR
jgi:hypothetical protein